MSAHADVVTVDAAKTATFEQVGLAVLSLVLEDFMPLDVGLQVCC